MKQPHRPETETMLGTRQASSLAEDEAQLLQLSGQASSLKEDDAQLLISI